MTPAVLADDDDLEVLWLEGTGNRLVVSFTGNDVEDRSAQGIEFPRIAAQGGRNHVAVVTDRRRSWYNTPGLVGRVVDTLGALAIRAGIGRIVTLGNSMGGYGAILFANPLGATRAISFVPQFTMNDRVVREERWREYKAAMPPFYVDSLADCMVPPTRFFVLHGGRGRDRKHYMRFPTGGHIRHYILPLRTHAAAARMKPGGALDALIQALLDDDEAGAARIMAAEGAHLRDPRRPGESWHMWAAGQSTRFGHRAATWLAERIAGPVRRPGYLGGTP